uniref:Uncharacterized protein n=1 Tax=Arundo donax TaxID=35708 RepID=A0A0A9AAQ1_ARUDO
MMLPSLFIYIILFFDVDNDDIVYLF